LLDGSVEHGDGGTVLLEIEELLRFYRGEWPVDAPAFEEVTKRPRRSIAGVVPALESNDRARPAEEGSFKASYRVHQWKAIGQVS
jgi:hypothetical protein